MREAININGEKLRGLLDDYCKANNTNMSALSKKMGFNSSYWSQTCKNNRITTVNANILELLGIKLDDYKKIEEVKEVEEEVPAPITQNVTSGLALLSKEELSNLIYQAVYSAIIHAWKEV